VGEKVETFKIQENAVRAAKGSAHAQERALQCGLSESATPILASIKIKKELSAPT
jgi:hypothetical protein